jgi:ankyrin repeat protein
MKDEKGNSFLHISVNENLSELVYYFLKKGLSPNDYNNEGDTPLHCAIKIEDKIIIQMLLDFEAKLEIQNKKGETAVDIASVN